MHVCPENSCATKKFTCHGFSVGLHHRRRPPPPETIVTMTQDAARVTIAVSALARPDAEPRLRATQGLLIPYPRMTVPRMTPGDRRSTRGSLLPGTPPVTRHTHTPSVVRIACPAVGPSDHMIGLRARPAASIRGRAPRAPRTTADGIARQDHGAHLWRETGGRTSGPGHLVVPLAVVSLMAIVLSVSAGLAGEDRGVIPATPSRATRPTGPLGRTGRRKGAARRRTRSPRRRRRAG